MNNPYIQETVARLRQEDLLREAQHYSEVSLLSSGRRSRLAEAAAALHLGHWLAAWAPRLRSARLGDDRAIPVSGRPCD